MNDTQNAVDPQALMQEIRNRVRGGASPGTSGAGGALADPTSDPLPADLADLFHLADVDVPRDVRTHRPLMGAYVRLRRWVLREIRLTLDPILGRQIALNRALVRVIADQQRRIAELEERLGGAPRQ